jgi:N-acetyl-anhydromuramyl-L-alanine amidase AmpD
MQIKWVKSPNFSAGRQGMKPEAIVIHIMQGTLAGTDAWFQNKPTASNVSAHYGIGRNGQIHQYVYETDAAWHAGRKSANAPFHLVQARPTVNPNNYTIGIEHEGGADDPWTDEVYAASAALIKEICHRWDIPVDAKFIIGHRDIYTVKSCPGNKVNINKLIELARGQVAATSTYNFVADLDETTARTTLRIRKAIPTTQAGVVAQARAGDRLAYVGWTSNGQSIAGISHWYKDENGNYFWAGGTTRPIPGLP